MYVGRIVETAPTAKLFASPRHPYTEALMSAVPKPNPRLRSERIVLQGEVADPANTPPGCHFHPRCKYAQAICREKTPVQEEIAPNHFVSCHRARELSLRGVARSIVIGFPNAPWTSVNRFTATTRRRSTPRACAASSWSTRSSFPESLR